MKNLWENERGAIYLFSVVLIAAMLVVLVGSLVALEKTTSGNILNREEELSYFQLESVKAIENKIASVMSLQPSGTSLQSELDRTISMLREQAEERGMWQNITYRIDFEPSSLDLSPRKVSFDITTRSRENTAYDTREFFLNDIFVQGRYLFVENRRMSLRFEVRPGSDEKEGYIEGGATYLGSDVILASSSLTDYLNMSTWTNATSVYHYTVDEQPGLITFQLVNETAKVQLTKFLYVMLDEVQFQVNVDPKVSSEASIYYGIGLTPNINGPESDRFRIDNTTGGPLNPSTSWANATAENETFMVERANSWVVVYDDDPQPYALALILDQADAFVFDPSAPDDCVIKTPARRGRFVVNAYIRSYASYLEAVTEMRELKKLGKPPLGRANYLEPLVLALTPDDLYFDPPAPKANTRVEIVAAIKNYGTKDAIDVVVHFYDGIPLADKSNLLGASNVTTILNGRTEESSTSWTFPEPGVHEIYVVVDPDNLLPEDPTDNERHAPLKIYPADSPIHDVEVEALHVSNKDPIAGDMVSISALLHNNGNREENDVRVTLQVIDAGNLSRNISSVVVPTLPINYHISVPISFIYQNGDERVRMLADAVFNESDLSNNVREAYISSSGVLIVADDNSGPKDGLRGSTSTYEFQAALNDSTKYHVTLWSEEDKSEPTVNVLLFFDAVVWTCGDYDGEEVETNDARTLVDFIDRGGHLVIEGEDIAYRHHQNATGPPDNFLWNVTKSHIDSYYDPDLFKILPLDDVELDGEEANAIPQINTRPGHPVMSNLPTCITSNYTAPYPDAILPVGSTELAVYESPDPNFLVLEDDLRSGLFHWTSSSEVTSAQVLSGGTAFRSTGNNYFQYTFPYEVGDGADEYRFIDVWFYFADADADIMLQVRDGSGSWNHRWGWDVESTYNGQSGSRRGTTLNCPQGQWNHYRLDLVTDLGLSPGTTIKGLAFSADDGDVYYDHIQLARNDSWKSSMVAYEDFGTGSKMVYMAYPVSAVENHTRKILIRNAIDWVGGRTINRAPLVSVTSPIGGELWTGPNNITWAASDPDGDPLAVSLYYSQNDGITWIHLASGLPAIGYWTWDTTMVPDGLYRIKAVADDFTLFAEESTSSFNVDNINDPPTVQVIWPNARDRLDHDQDGYSGTEQILWAASDPEGDPLTYDIEWSRDGSTWTVLVSGYSPPDPLNPSYLWNTWTVPDDVNYRIRVRATDGANTVEDTSQLFSIDHSNQDPSIWVTSPNGGEVWSGTHTVTWDMDDPDGAGYPLGDPYRDTLLATVDYASSDAIYNGSYAPDSMGFFRDWLLLGGFPGNNIGVDYMGGESLAQPWLGKDDGGKRWWVNHDSDNKIDLETLMTPVTGVTGYAFAYVYNPTDRDVRIWVGSDDQVKIRLNGAVIHTYPNQRSASEDQDAVDVHLPQGWNTLLVKVAQGTGRWAFYFRITERTTNPAEPLTDTPITDLRIALDRPNSYDTGMPATGGRLGSVVNLQNLNWNTATVPNGNYTVTVSVQDGRGGTASDSSDSLFEIVNNRDPVVEVVYPNGEEILFGNVTLVWDATDPDGDPMTFDLYYRRGSGSWTHIDTITNSTWRWYLWDVSGLPDSPPEYYVKVEARDGRGGLGLDVSDDGWYINNADGDYGPGGPGNYTGFEGPGGQVGGGGRPPGWGEGGSEEPADRASLVMLLTPLGGEEWKDTKTISWTHDGFGSGLKFKVWASPDSWATQTLLASDITATSYSWDTTSGPDSDAYRIMVEGYDDESNVDTDSSEDFMVYNNQRPTVSLTSPTGGEKWEGVQTITWSASDPDGDGDNDPTTPYQLVCDVYYWNNSISAWVQIGFDVTTNSLSWDTTTVPDGDRYRIRVFAEDGNIKGDRSDSSTSGYFMIDNHNSPPNQPRVDYPNGGEKLEGTVRVRWTASDPDGDVLTYSLYYSSDMVTWNPLKEDFTGVSYYDWDTTTVPDGTQYLVKVEARDPDGEMKDDASNSIFTIDNTDPTVSVTQPSYPPTPVVKKTVKIAGKASDVGGSGLKGVEIWVDGVLWGEATFAADNWSFDIDTTTLPEDATVEVEARAYDYSGNTASVFIKILIDNVGN